MSVETSPVSKRGGLEQKWKVLISVMFGIFMIILDSTIVNIAFPTLRRVFGASLADAQWVISIYVLALGITTPVSGYLADRFGIKRVYLLGLAIFAFGSFLCGIAPSLGLLIAARAPCRDLAAGSRSRWTRATLPRFSTERAGYRAGHLWNCTGSCSGTRSDLGRLAGGHQSLARDFLCQCADWNHRCDSWLGLFTRFSY